MTYTRQDYRWRQSSIRDKSRWGVYPLEPPYIVIGERGQFVIVKGKQMRESDDG